VLTDIARSYSVSHSAISRLRWNRRSGAIQTRTKNVTIESEGIELLSRAADGKPNVRGVMYQSKEDPHSVRE